MYKHETSHSCRSWLKSNQPLVKTWIDLTSALHAGAVCCSTRESLDYHQLNHCSKWTMTSSSPAPINLLRCQKLTSWSSIFMFWRTATNWERQSNRPTQYVIFLLHNISYLGENPSSWKIASLLLLIAMHACCHHVIDLCKNYLRESPGENPWGSHNCNAYGIMFSNISSTGIL